MTAEGGAARDERGAAVRPMSERLAADDPARASVRAAESALALARAEIRLAVFEARAMGRRAAVALVATASALLALHVLMLALVAATSASIST